ASGEDDVVPPVRGWNRHVEDVRVRDGAFVSDLDLDRFPAVEAGARYVAIDVQGGGDAEGVPGAVSVPRAAAGLDAVRRRNGRERIRHPDLGLIRLARQAHAIVDD